MAETTLEIAREIAEAWYAMQGLAGREARKALAALITEKLTPLVEKAEKVVHMGGPREWEDLRRELERIKG